MVFRQFGSGRLRLASGRTPPATRGATRGARRRGRLHGELRVRGVRAPWPLGRGEDGRIGRGRSVGEVGRMD